MLEQQRLGEIALKVTEAAGRMKLAEFIIENESFDDFLDRLRVEAGKKRGCIESLDDSEQEEKKALQEWANDYEFIATYGMDQMKYLVENREVLKSSLRSTSF